MTTDDDNDRRQQAKHNTGPLGGPVIIRYLPSRMKESLQSFDVVVSATEKASASKSMLDKSHRVSSGRCSHIQVTKENQAG